jgi:hypothetical protein
MFLKKNELNAEKLIHNYFFDLTFDMQKKHKKYFKSQHSNFIGQHFN